MTGTERGDPCVWQSAEGSVRVVIRPHAAERMRREALRCAGESRRTEQGGILLGFVEPGDTRAVTVEDVQPVAWPSLMQPLDPKEMETALRARTASDPQCSVVGYYRTHRHGNFFLTPGDMSLIRSCFPDPGNIFLLLRPAPGGVLERRLYFWEDGIIRSAPDVRVPLWRETPGPSALPPEEDPAPRSRGKRTLWTVAGATAATLTLLLAPARWYLPSSPSPASGPPGATPPQAAAKEIGLEVRKEGEGLLLRWDRGSPAVQHALRAVLHIADGDQQRASELDVQQLRHGSVYYTPRGGDVRFRMEIHGPSGEPAVELVQVLSAGPPEQARRQRQLSTDPFGQAPPQQPEVQSPEETPSQWVAERLKELRSLRSRYAPKTPEPKPVILAGAPPRVAGSTAAVASASAPVTALPQAPPQPQPVREEPAPARPVARPSTRVPPKAIVQVNPTVLPAALAMLPGDVLVEVRVGIDASGSVTSAEVINREGPVNAAIRESALAAARKWRFQPATVSGTPVPSSMLLAFRFKR